MIVEGTHDLQATEHPEASVESACGGHRVDVAADENRGERIVEPGAARVYVADGVHPDGQARVPHPTEHQLTAGDVVVGEC